MNKKHITKGESTMSMSISEEFNKVRVSGIAKQEFEFSHIYWQEKQYKTTIGVKRESGVEDVIIITIPEHLKPDSQITGKMVAISGQIGSYYGQDVDNKKHLRLTVVVTSIEVTNEQKMENEVYLEGNVGITPLFRETPKDRRLTELMLNVDWRGNVKNYIPCIAWENNSYHASRAKVGDRVRIWGRLQSREVFVTKDYNDKKTRTVYEISIGKLLVHR